MVMTETQNLEFSIKVKCPKSENPDAETRGYIAVDGKKIQDFSIVGATEQTVDFELSLEDAEHEISVHHTYSPDPLAACIIESITVDQIDLGIILYSGEYHPTYPEPWYSDESAAGRTPREVIGGKEANDGSMPLFMGWEGVYSLKFYTPLYEWLLDNL